MSIQFIVQELKQRQKEVKALLEEMSQLVNAIEASGAYQGYGMVATDTVMQRSRLETLRQQAVSSFAFNPHTTCEAILRNRDAIELNYTTILEKLEEPYMYLVAMDGEFHAESDTDDIAKAIRHKIEQSSNMQEEAHDFIDKHRMAVFPVLNLPYDVTIDYEPGQLDTSTESAEPDAYVLYRNGHEVDTFSDEDELLEHVRDEIRNEGYAAGDFTFEKVEKTSYAIEEETGDVSVTLH